MAVARPEEGCWKEGFPGACIHGTCVEGKCVCDPNYVGEDCSFNLFAAWKYLPYPSDRAGWWDQATWDKYHEEMGKVNSESQCSSAMKFPYLPGPEGKGAGLGSSLFYMMGDLTEAFSKGKPYSFTGRLNYADNAYCGEKGLSGNLECYFEKRDVCTTTEDRDAWVPARRPRPSPGLSKKKSSQTCTLGA